ncbi:MAG: hypothetical protein NTX25_12300 [Proteobacteria bacterium]|nr:hypothetical protein [Pseudomonadota bacterium]
MNMFEHWDKLPKSLLISLSFFGVSQLQAAETTPGLSWDKDIKAIVTDNCSYCHSGAQASAGLSLETQADVLKTKTDIIALVSAGQMPAGDPTWKDTEDAKKLLTWLKAQN